MRWQDFVLDKKTVNVCILASCKLCHVLIKWQYFRALSVKAGSIAPKPRSAQAFVGDCSQVRPWVSKTKDSDGDMQ